MADELVGAGTDGRDPARLSKGVGRLVLTLTDVLRQLLERQAGRRMEAGALSPSEVELLGRALMKLEQRIRELKQVFELDADEELDIRLGAMDGKELSVVELVDALLARGVTLSGDLTLSIAGIDLLYVVLRLAIASPDTFRDPPNPPGVPQPVT